MPSIAEQLLKIKIRNVKVGRISFFMFDEIKKREDEFPPVLFYQT